MTPEDRMKNVDLIEVSLDELGGMPPEAGAEVVLKGVRYHVLGVTPPKGQPPQWSRKRAAGQAGEWKLLLCAPEGAAADDEFR